MKKERDEKKEREARLLKRQQLKTLSQSLVARREMGEYMGNEDDTVNGLLRFHYACKGYTNLKTFKEWKEAGYTVRKGEKALLIWGMPITSKAEKQRIEELKKQGREEEPKEDFFPLCYLFADSQVHKLEK